MQNIATEIVETRKPRRLRGRAPVYAYSAPPKLESQSSIAILESQNEPTFDSRNGLNDLSGREWIQETVSVWRQKGLGASHPHTKFEKLHPAPFSFQDVARLIQFFTKKGMLVLDPFVGVGSSLKAAALSDRQGIGIELSPKWASLARKRLIEEAPGKNGQQVWCMDIRDAIVKIKDGSVDFVVTSPPYWSILGKKADHKVKATRVSRGLEQKYSADSRDLGNISNYKDFLDALTDIFNKLAPKIVPGKYCAIVVSDFKHGSRYYPFHSDLYNGIDRTKLALCGITILHQSHKALYPYGYPFAYVPNVHHQYILLFRRPKTSTLS